MRPSIMMYVPHHDIPAYYSFHKVSRHMHDEKNRNLVRFDIRVLPLSMPKSPEHMQCSAEAGRRKAAAAAISTKGLYIHGPVPYIIWLWQQIYGTSRGLHCREPCRGPPTHQPPPPPGPRGHFFKVWQQNLGTPWLFILSYHLNQWGCQTFMPLKPCHSAPPSPAWSGRTVLQALYNHTNLSPKCIRLSRRLLELQPFGPT